MTHVPLILIVEDDDEIRELVCDYLSANGFDARGVRDGAAMSTFLARQAADLIVLDIMLPGGEDGLSICRRIRASSNTPIIMLTARGDDIDRIIGIELGADDYLAKPFNPRELTARINAVLRRTHGQNDVKDTAHTSYCGHLIIHHERREVRTEAGELLILSSGEYDLLTIFLSRPQRVLDRDVLMDLLNGRVFNAAFDRSIDVQVSRLRRKIEPDPANPVLIKTIRNVGYVLSEKVRSA
ncbi:response regulator [Ponticaulis profundi]|uniref:Response regulator n=1 Tax=Ponticaulis profundi TaxID=2665222 RepID=A0ABW1S9M1_9PROT